MEPNQLQTVAEVGVAIVGFSGIVALFSKNLKLENGGINRLRFIDLLLSGFGAVFLSFVPVATHNFQVSAPSVWLISEVFMVGWFVMTLIILFRLGRHSEPESSVHLILPVIGVTLTLLLIASVVGLLTFAGGSLFLIGLLWLLGIASLQFCTLLLKAIYGS